MAESPCVATAAASFPRKTICSYLQKNPVNLSIFIELSRNLWIAGLFPSDAEFQYPIDFISVHSFFRTGPGLIMNRP